MSLIANTGCPHCMSWIERSQPDPALFVCDVCGCEFQRNPRRMLRIPVAVVVSLTLLGLLHLLGIEYSSFLFKVFFAAIMGINIFIAGYPLPAFTIVSAGRELPTGAEVDPPEHVHWLVSTLLVLGAVTLAVLAFYWGVTAG